MLSPADLFRHQTVAALAQAVRAADDSAPAPTAESAGPLPLTPIQTAFFAAEMPRRHHWNQSVLLECREPLDPGHLERALQALVDHHGALRLRYREEPAGWSQQPAEPGQSQELLRRQRAEDGAALAAIVLDTQRSLDLQRGPLLRAAHVRLADGGERLLLVAHHLVVDGVSWRILLEDLESAYRQLTGGKEPQLPPSTSPFRAWTEALQGYAGTEAVAAQMDC